MREPTYARFRYPSPERLYEPRTATRSLIVWGVLVATVIAVTLIAVSIVQSLPPLHF